MLFSFVVFLFKHKTAYVMRIRCWSSDVCSSDLRGGGVKKVDVLSVARLAGIMGAKRTPDLIPLCHPLALTSVAVDLTVDEERSAVDITATCKLKGRTGVEMEDRKSTRLNSSH